MIIFSKISYFFYFHRSFNPQLLFISRLSKIKLTFLGTTFYEQSEIYKYLKNLETILKFLLYNLLYNDIHRIKYRKDLLTENKNFFQGIWILKFFSERPAEY